MPEATRQRETRKLYTECELKTGGVDAVKGREPDHIVYQGTEYEVQNVADWQRQGNYFKYLLVKAGQ